MNTKSTLYVIDNGMAGDEHRIYFVDTKYHDDLVRMVVSATGFYLLGKINPIEWYGPRRPLEDVLDAYDFFDGRNVAGELKDSYRQLPRRILLTVARRDGIEKQVRRELDG